MKITKGLVFCDDFELQNRDVYCDGDTITDSGAAGDGEVLDATGCIVSPGFVDIHIHGAYGTDFCDGTTAANENIAKYLSSTGVTSYLGTTMAYDKDKLVDMMGCAGELMDHPRLGSAVMRGINLEGPFASEEKKGAMQAEYLVKPDFEYFMKLFNACGKRIKLTDIAPELEGGMDLVEKASKVSVVSLAHTNADYDTAKKAFESGASHVTHLFNAMPPLNHRDPGVIGAACDFANQAELICDGIHIHPSAIRAAFKLFGDDRICLISDSMMACGMSNGVYSLGGQTVTVLNGKATLESGTIAGSATPLTECFRRAVKLFGIPLISGLKAATANPARAIGMSDLIGSITPKKRADFTLFDAETLMVKHCVIGGKLVF